MALEEVVTAVSDDFVEVEEETVVEEGIEETFDDEA